MTDVNNDQSAFFFFLTDTDIDVCSGVIYAQHILHLAPSSSVKDSSLSKFFEEQALRREQMLVKPAHIGEISVL